MRLAPVLMALSAGLLMAAAPPAADKTRTLLIHFAQDDRLVAIDQLAVYRLLTTPEALGRIAEADRPSLSVWLYARYARLLFETGLTGRAVALIDGLPADLRGRVLELPAGSFTAHVEGVPITVRVDRRDEALKLALAAAYAAAGRAAEAESLFGSFSDMPAVRHAFDCAWAAGAPEDASCAHLPYERRIGQTIDLLLLDHLLHHPDDDPYPLAETGFSTELGGGSSPAVVELRCRVFSEARFAEICDAARRARLYWLERGSPREIEEGRAALAALHVPGLAESRAEFAAALAPLNAAREAAYGRDLLTRATVIPAPAPFAELPLPPAYRGPRPPVSRPDAGFGSLPEGFEPVRFERDGNRAVAISLSQTYDPTGEVSQGGYWVHLSDDGGRHWQPPLYTGLADRFPYVVPSTSRMTLLNGDRLDLEVEVAELDTASITYPPVALRSRRHATNLYLQIPLAELARDSNGDGITDVAAHRLLLDRARTDGGTPFIVGTDSSAHCVAPDRDRAAQVALLGQLFNDGGHALVEPLDRPRGDIGLMVGWRGAAAAPSRPIFIRGNARDYFCLRPNRLMIVYGESDLAELSRFHPDFHAIEVPQIVFNRARDRGYVQWSAGWTGGTYRLRLANGAWVLDQIGSWIS